MFTKFNSTFKLNRMRNRFSATTTQQLTEQVRALRKAQGKTQTDVARMLGVSTARVATIEKDVGRLSTHNLLKLLQLLGAQLEINIDSDVGAQTLPQRPQSSSVATRHRTPRRELGGEW
ncbi:MAG: helix-turn-helix transcriptional regulator [Gemmatimonadaceae bacterium]|nr:helix-turn-helix transcriptional regulator [Gemmatimonadaceae bacterium]